ncbi:MAG: 4Fe-4S binding protein [Endomicrobium sp.]|jgi:MauM/NapG family ferredoxin protein|nr:4Fe-4S binding protein [Endomicrobium sp.]
MKKLKATRVISQIFFFLLVAAAFTVLTFPIKFIDTKEFFLTSPSLLIFSEISAVYLTKGMAVLLIFIIIAFLFGRVFCGWICPFGAVMDFFVFLLKPLRKYKESKPDKKLMIKYYALAVFAVLAVLGYQFVWIFEPITVFSRFFHLSLFPFFNAVTDKFFQYIIMNHDFGENIYYAISNNIFSARSISFKYSFAFFVLFMIPLLAAAFRRRFWCRYICPLGASLGILSVNPKFALRKKACSSDCGRCEQICRSNAIKHDGSYISSECVMCMDCTILKCYKPIENKKPCQKEIVQNSGLCQRQNKGISRKQFFLWISGAVAAIYVLVRKAYAASHFSKNSVIRPPGAMKEKEFKAACVRCGNCMKACITNGLQPVMFESGFDGIWTPKIDNITGYCEYNCNACGQVCPTQAIKALTPEEKLKQKLGKADIVKNVCVPWKDGIECLVCEEHCPVAEKAIKFVKEIINGKETDVPIVDADLCIGCGVCENKCPVEGRKRGITVNPI